MEAVAAFDLDSEFHMGGDGSAQLMQAAAAANHAQAIIITLLVEYDNIFGEGAMLSYLYSDSYESGSERKDKEKDRETTSARKSKLVRPLRLENRKARHLNLLVNPKGKHLNIHDIQWEHLGQGSNYIHDGNLSHLVGGVSGQSPSIGDMARAV
ncbi:rho GTPase activation protein, PH domain-like protein [Artemisia annua]|uniref:Rho GTPase activation protein, PH domain-like protein n=1 Tax=Artemisia annua TaxID=35608 RepID=A0A2U1L8B7_ARTAN|nr:rho GTPase activation protein, PH domain-like protein [Artemisia annua]